MGGGPQIVSNKERLQFIPHKEVQIQYKGDEDIYVNLRLGDSFHDDAFRCAQPLSAHLTLICYLWRERKIKRRRRMWEVERLIPKRESAMGAPKAMSNCQRQTGIQFRQVTRPPQTRVCGAGVVRKSMGTFSCAKDLVVKFNEEPEKYCLCYQGEFGLMLSSNNRERT
ncbi:unnamed protein product, partial [Porites lobata]